MSAHRIGVARWGIWFLSSMAAFVLPTGAAEPKLADLVPIKLTAGVNRIPKFAPDGRDGLIVLGWRDNGNAHGYDLYVVLLPTKPGASDWNVVGIFPKGYAAPIEDTIQDDPHLGEDVVRAVRFARGTLDGKPTTLLITATRELDVDVGIPGPSFTSFDVYRLTPSDGGIGSTADFFERVSHERSTTKFCNALMALFRAFGLALPASYAGPKTVDGCPKD